MKYFYSPQTSPFIFGAKPRTPAISQRRLRHHCEIGALCAGRFSAARYIYLFAKFQFVEQDKGRTSIHCLLPCSANNDKKPSCVLQLGFNCFTNTAQKPCLFILLFCYKSAPANFSSFAWLNRWNANRVFITMFTTAAAIIT